MAPALEFIAAVTAPLEKWPVERQQVGGELMQRLQDHGLRQHYHLERRPPPRAATTFPQALQRLKSATPLLTLRTVRWQMLGVFALILALHFAASMQRQVEARVDHQATFVFDRVGLDKLGDWQIARLKVGEPLFTDWWNRGESLERIAQLQARWPQDPAIYQAYAQTFQQSTGHLPEDYDAHWRALEPDNAFWLALEAGALAQQRSRGPGGAIAVSPENDAKALRVVALLEEASRLPHWIDRRRELLARQRAAFRRPATLAEDAAVARETDKAEIGAPPDYDSLVAELGGGPASSVPKSAAVLEAWDRLTRLRLTQPGSARPERMPGLDRIHSTARDLSREADAMKRVDLLQRLDQLREIRPHVAGDVPLSSDPQDAQDQWDRYSHYPASFHDMQVRLAGDPFQARRIAEYAVLDRGQAIRAVAALALLLSFALVTGLRRSVAGLIAGTEPLFPWRSTVRMVVFGVLLPALAWWALARASVASCRQYGIGHLEGMHLYADLLGLHIYSMQTIAGLILLACSLIGVADREIWEKAGFLGSGRRWPWVGAVMRILTALALVIPAVFPLTTMLPEKLLNRAGPVMDLLLAAPMLWLLWRFWMGLIVQRSSPVAAALFIGRIRWPLALACLLLLGSLPVLSIIERSCLKRDVLSSGGPEEARWHSQRVDAEIASLREQLK
jgi:hypothetical protein